MKQIFSFLLWLFYGLCVSAQINFTALPSHNLYYNSHPFNINWDYHTHKNLIAAYGDGAYFSNSVNAEIFNAFFLKYHIDQEMKDRVSGKLSDNKRLGLTNSVGIDGDVGLTYAKFSDSLPKIGSGTYFVSLRYRYHANFKFSKDLFDLFFYGNRRFKGKTAEFGSTDLNKYRYAQLQFGVEKRFQEANGDFEAGFALSLLQGISFASLRVDDGSIFTQKDGEYLDVDLDFQSYISDTGNTGPFAFNGWGVSTDLFFSYTGRNGNHLRIMVSDIGFISWNDKSLVYQKDTSFQFDGFEMNFTNLASWYFGNLNTLDEDSLIRRYGLAPETKRHTTVLPVRVDLNYTYRVFNSKIWFTPGIQFHLFAHTIPLIYLNGSYVINPNFIISIYNGYGGFGGYGFGLHLEGYTFGLELNKRFKKYHIVLGSKAIQGYLFPERQPGMSGYTRIIRTF